MSGSAVNDKHVILIIDDNTDNLQVLGSMLDQHGYEVSIASSGPEALEIIKSLTPDLILLDIMMPGMDGFEVCRLIKADPALKLIPVIFISAMGMTDQKITAFNEGAVDYITKPFQAAEVVAKVQMHIQLAGLEELRQEIDRRIKAEEELHNLNVRLEDLVTARTVQLKEANECLESFCSSISHDLRTPLSEISSLCQILSDKYSENFDKEGMELLEYILTGTQMMDDRIHALLAFSRLNRGELVRTPVDLSKMASKILSAFCDAEPERKVATTIQGEIMVQADPSLICAVMENLLGNAWKYTGKTLAPHIEFGTESSGTETILFVRDNGAGFSMAKADKLFGMFQRLHNEDDFAGDGIGLATVQRIVHRHGGRIWAEAEPGKGATFRFTLPWKVGAET